ncbi:MAG: NAD(P)H-hydrate dehydratase [Roseinatronobacter sp.]
MTEILSSAQMRAIEAAQIESGDTTGLALMELAGQGVVDAICARWPAPAKAVVFCGPGNNGGDGYVIARKLAEMGWQVLVWAPVAPATPDAVANAQRWGVLGQVVKHLDPACLPGCVAVDALFGTGLTRPVAEKFWSALAQAQQAGAKLVAVDILSGICADSGQIRADGAYSVQAADLTVTFQAPKLGHMLLPGGAMTGALVVVDIGLKGRIAELRAGASAEQVTQTVSPPDLALLTKGAGHKYSYGHALVLSGGVGRGGAARLAARAALRVGAGLVTLCCPPAALIENAARLDAIMLRPVADEVALTNALTDPRITALCLGPGLGLGRRECGLVAAALRSKRPIVLDADALSLIAQNPDLRALVHADCVLTPHAGEFARLWPDLGTSEHSKLKATCRAAQDIGAVVLFKGADTVIAGPDGFPEIHAALRDRAAPWLATAGTGDVLAGLITGLLARGIPPRTSARTGAWLHVEAARQFGAGLLAEDLPEQLPQVLRRLGA